MSILSEPRLVIRLDEVGMKLTLGLLTVVFWLHSFGHNFENDKTIQRVSNLQCQQRAKELLQLFKQPSFNRINIQSSCNILESTGIMVDMLMMV